MISKLLTVLPFQACADRLPVIAPIGVRMVRGEALIKQVALIFAQWGFAAAINNTVPEVLRDANPIGCA